MTRNFTASVWQEDSWFVAQCLQLDVASQGESESAAIANLKEALALHLEEPSATIAPVMHDIVVDLDAA